MVKPKPNPSKIRRSDSQEKQIIKKYGITENQYQEMLQSQNEVCAICQKHQRKRRLSIDHNHRTGKVRGLLCNWCNRAIGKFFDSAEYLRKAADYLDKTNFA